MSDHEVIETKDGYETHLVYGTVGLTVRVAKEGTEIAVQTWQDVNHEKAADWARQQIKSHRKAVAKLRRT